MGSGYCRSMHSRWPRSAGGRLELSARLAPRDRPSHAPNTRVSRRARPADHRLASLLPEWGDSISSYGATTSDGLLADSAGIA